ncbi:hypothetical protein QBC35DRAFT_17556 [Podospora australis]|uniref:Fungal N-terminal domain-containing protein n=1 Tax=Podospora australis TaxID=1536484 RepID=A0AAN6WQ07_9PEZI|nr:hypothetical protein QBC35DRAFT_17556 [Podospora australis]
MEWAAAIGVASGILSFSTFAHEVLKATRDLRRKGSIADHQQLARQTQAMKSAAESLKEPVEDMTSEKRSSVSIHVKALQNIATDSAAYCDRLLEILHDLDLMAVPSELAPSER